MNSLKDIVVVGGGTSGLISALMLKTTFPLSNIKLIKSSKIKIVGVGEGCTEHWSDFIDYVDLDIIDLINNTDATIKIGILFNNWTKQNNSYCHSIDQEYGETVLGNLEIFNHLVLNGNNDPFILSKNFKEIYLKNKVVLNPDYSPSSNQFHFDTFKLNSYLIKKCIERNIDVIDDLVKDVELDPNGNITHLITKNTLIKGDFFIDCSGFKRILLSKLGAKWVSYKDYLPMNQAIAFPTNLNLEKGIEPYTTLTALQNGWSWKSPTQQRYGNGYVFSNLYTNSDKALKEVNLIYNQNIEKVAKDIKFEAGKVNEFWIKNCVGIGLSSNFTEPLEAPSIGFNIVQMFSLINHFNSWKFDSSQSKKYNYTMNQVFQNIVDYIQLHYITDKDNSKFWKDKPYILTEFNKNTLNRFSEGYFSSSDFGYNPHLIYNSQNFYQIYYGLGLLTSKKIHNHLTQLNSNFRHTYWFNKTKSQFKEPLMSTINHIDYLKLIKENYSS